MTTRVAIAAPAFVGVTVCLALASACTVRPWPGSDESPDSPPAATAAAALEGTVTDAAGAPLAGAHVTTSPRGIEATTDADGHWAIARVLPGEVVLVVAAEGYTPQKTGSITLVAGETSVEDVVLEPAVATAGVVRVHVTGPGGEAIPDATVSGTDGAATVEATTDSAGDARLAGLGGATVTVSVVDESGRLTGFSVGGLSVPTAGGIDVGATLAGRPAGSSTFVGSAACVACHEEASAAFEASAHANALTAVVGAPAGAFDLDETVRLGAATATLTRVGGAPTVVLTDASGAVDSWPVTGFLGGEARGAIPWSERGDHAWALPVAWIAPDPERVGFADGGWVAGDTAPWLDSAGNLAYSGAPATSATAEANCFGCHATGYTLASAGGVVSMVASTGTGRWDEAGVGCEACHGAGSEHIAADDADRLVTITNPAHLGTDRANDVCGQCHDSREGNAGTPYAWSATHGRFLPGDDAAEFGTSTFVGWSNASARVPHAQVEELSGSTHSTAGGASRCSDCHTSHGGGHTAETRQPVEDNTLCLSCHSVLNFAGSAEAAAAHQAHPLYLPTELVQEGRCTGCHMPSTAAQLAWSNTTGAGDLRSHRFAIVAPAATLADFGSAGATELAAGEFLPNACQECHAWNQDLFDGHFPGPAGDMTLRGTHELLDAAYQEMFP